MHTLNNLGSLITYQDGDAERCLGFLWHAKEHGTFDASLGRVDVTMEQADVHNRLLEEAMLKGLDDNCEVGQGGSFYFQKKDGKPCIRTFLGTIVSDQLSIKGRSVTFRRGERLFRGRISELHDLFNFKRVA